MVSVDSFDLSMIKGEKIEKVFVHYVEPEVNIVFILFRSSKALELSGLEGSEILGASLSNKSRLDDFHKNGFIVEYFPSSIFKNKEIETARVIGVPSDGHGIEISFIGVPDRTMIVQSIYSGGRKPSWHDCLRLGIGEYNYTFKNGVDKELIKDVIDKWNPVGLLPNAPSDEYDIETQKVYCCCVVAKSVFQLAEGIHSIFTGAFGSGVFAKSPEECIRVAQEIWKRVC